MNEFAFCLHTISWIDETILTTESPKSKVGSRICLLVCVGESHGDEYIPGRVERPRVSLFLLEVFHLKQLCYIKTDPSNSLELFVLTSSSSSLLPNAFNLSSLCIYCLNVSIESRHTPKMIIKKNRIEESGCEKREENEKEKRNCFHILHNFFCFKRIYCLLNRINSNSKTTK